MFFSFPYNRTSRSLSNASTYVPSNNRTVHFNNIDTKKRDFSIPGSLIEPYRAFRILRITKVRVRLISVPGFPSDSEVNGLAIATLIVTCCNSFVPVDLTFIDMSACLTPPQFMNFKSVLVLVSSYSCSNDVRISECLGMPAAKRLSETICHYLVLR